jgi:hypothetical protein
MDDLGFCRMCSGYEIWSYEVEKSRAMDLLFV